MKKGHGSNNMTKDWKHDPSLSAEDIAKIIREGREYQDNKFETYAQYLEYIAKDNDRILNEYDHDHSKCEPNEITKEAMEEADAGLTQRGYSYEVQQIEGRDNV